MKEKGKKQENMDVKKHLPRLLSGEVFYKSAGYRDENGNDICFR